MRALLFGSFVRHAAELKKLSKSVAQGIATGRELGMTQPLLTAIALGQASC